MGQVLIRQVADLKTEFARQVADLKTEFDAQPKKPALDLTEIEKIIQSKL